MKSGIEYVIRAKKKEGKMKREESFEDWMKSIRSEYVVE